MAYPLTPTFERARQELEKDGVRSGLLKIAERRTKNAADAVDLVQEALAKVFAPNGSPWDPDGEKSFFLHTGSLINRLANHEWHSARVRHGVVDSSLAHDKKIVDPAPPVEETLAESRENAERVRKGEVVLAELGDDDPIATGVLLAAREGHDTPAKQAARIGCRVEAVYDAYDRLKYVARKVLEREQAAEARRLRERRERWEKDKKDKKGDVAE